MSELRAVAAIAIQVVNENYRFFNLSGVMLELRKKGADVRRSELVALATEEFNYNDDVPLCRLTESELKFLYNTALWWCGKED